ncbi:MAG: type II/IV secretion system protein, partial [Candidatus Parcubacteria bacterium]|nr:type II/IV secretion system protein [Burkholderiales bacterium]
MTGVRPAAEVNALCFTGEELARARNAAAAGAHFLESLEEISAADAWEFLARLAATAGLRVASIAELHALAPAFDLMPFPEGHARGCAMFRDESRAPAAAVLVLADPFDRRLRAWAEETAGTAFEVRLAHRGDIAAWHARHEETVRAMDGMGAREGAAAAGAGDAEDLSLKRIHEDTSPVVKLVNSTLYDALKIGASDVHIESTGAGLAVRYRLDGVLSPVARVEGDDQAEQVLSRIKVMANLDIAERRVPQDGRIKVSVRGREIDLRVSVIPSIFGEDAVLRILDKQALSDEARGLRLDRLGFTAGAMRELRELAREPYGMMLVTGPTGSGKTTTLYAAITEINDGHDKIVTIEDPVEYQLPGVMQIPVNEKKGLTFARGLRSILRHDPDKIMVGEIRDPETAQIAVQAALTGHLVFTTVHANSVIDVIGRFIHMGIDPYNLVAALNGIAAQRLLRIL